MKSIITLLALSPLIVGIGMASLIMWLGYSQAAASSRASLDSLIWPISGNHTPDTASISSPFGPRWQTSQGRYDYHPGLDIVAPIDTPVHVITDGLISKVGWLSPDSGLTVVVYHPSLSLYSAYLHLNSTNVITNQTVTQGQVIGYVGNSGTTEFIHLHFEIRLTLGNYPASTRNPMGYLSHPEVSTPTIRITDMQSMPIYSPTVSLAITTTRTELDVNRIRVILQDRASGAVLDNQLIDLNERLHTGLDTLDQDGIRLRPAHFNKATPAYELDADFYQLHGYDTFTLTAQVTDLAGHMSTVVATANDTTPPGQVVNLFARWRTDNHVNLTWSAPGDSDQVGSAAAYDIRYAHTPIMNSSDWDYATPLTSPPTPLSAMQSQGWSPPVTFTWPAYFALRAKDPEGNWSAISNSAETYWPIYLPMIDN